jgi:hypothetical protein
LRKFVSADIVPEDIDAKLLPMKGWGLIGPSKQRRLCDVFLLQIETDLYRIQIQESPANVLIGIQLKQEPDGQAPKVLMLGVAERVLTKPLQLAASETDRARPRRVDDHPNVAGVSWFLPRVATERSNKDGQIIYAISADKVGEIGTHGVSAFTDGQHVWFNIPMAFGGSSMGDPYPYRPRFQLPEDAGKAADLPKGMARLMRWPSKAEIEEHSCDASVAHRARCSEWLAKFINEGILPEGIESELLPMREWGLIAFLDEKERPADVFLAEMQTDRYRIQVQESVRNVLLGIQLKQPPEEQDPKALVFHIAEQVLVEGLQPGEDGALHTVAKPLADNPSVTRVSWLLPSVAGGPIMREGKQAGRRILSHKVQEAGTMAVVAYTDGQFLWISLYKAHAPFAALFPSLSRFSPTKPVDEPEP